MPPAHPRHCERWLTCSARSDWVFASAGGRQETPRLEHPETNLESAMEVGRRLADISIVFSNLVRPSAHPARPRARAEMELCSEYV